MSHAAPLSALLLLAIAADAAAEENPLLLAAAEDSVRWMEEVLVTARKRAELAQDVPISLSVFSGDELRQSGINRVGELALFAPGLSFEETYGRQLDRPVMRGMSTILSGTQIEQNMAFYIDGVFVAGAVSATTLDDVERVEVLRGPQNALFGRTALSGAVNFITHKPSKEFEGRIKATIATHDEYRANVMLSGPLVEERLLFRLNAGYYTYGGEYKNTVTNKTIGGEETKAVATQLQWQISENLSATAKVAYSEDDDEHPPIRLQDSSYNNCFLNTPDQYYCGKVKIFDEVALNTDAVDGGGLRRKTWRTSLMIDWDFDSSRLTSITSYNDEELWAGIDLDGTAINAINGFFQTVDINNFEDFSQEVRLTSPAEARLRWMVGGYYYDFTQDGENIKPQPGDKATDKTENYALFGQLQFDLSDVLTASAEMRAAKDKKSLIRADGVVFRENFTTLNPRLALEYKYRPEILLYATIAKGSKPGGFNSNASLPPELRSFDEERAWNYEAGLKGSWPERRLSYSLSAFYIDWTKQQLTSSFDNPNGRPIIYTQNAGETEVSGIEAELSVQPVDAFYLRANYALVNAEFERFDVAEQAALTGDPSVAGNKTPRAPKHMASLSGTYSVPLGGDWQGYVHGDLTYESKRFAQVHNLAHSGDKVIASLHGGVESGNVGIDLWVKNLFNDKYATSITRYRDFAGFNSFQAPRAFVITLPRGRQFGASATYRF